MLVLPLLLAIAGQFPDALPDALPDAVEVAQMAELPLPEPAAEPAYKIVMVTGRTCGPCATMKPLLNNLEGITVVFMDLDDPRTTEWLDGHQVPALPYLIGYKDDQPIDARVGAMNENELAAWVRKLKGEQPAQPATESKGILRRR